MKVTAGILAVSVACVCLAGCNGYVAPVMPPRAGLYSNITAPMDHDMGGEKVGTKTGSASSHQFLGLFAWGDAGIQTAASNGGITKIDHADYRYLNVWVIYAKFTTVVIGD